MTELLIRSGHIERGEKEGEGDRENILFYKITEILRALSLVGRCV